MISENLGDFFRGEEMKVIRDPVHGDIAIRSPIAAAVIDHPIFQRLRKISQTGLCQYVFPGMKHSRFEHSLGSYHLALQFFDNLYKRYKTNTLYPIQKNTNDFLIADSMNIWHQIFTNESVTEVWRTNFSLAALLHDIGHGPFSHTFERSGLLKNFSSHEDVSIHYTNIVLKDIGINAQRIQHISALINPKITENVETASQLLSPLISGVIDVDRLDYVSRDAMMAGVNYGRIEIQRTLNIISPVLYQNSHTTALLIPEKHFTTIDHYLFSLYQMYTQVYLHPTAVRMEFELCEILKKAKFSMPISKEWLKKSGDEDLINALCKKDKNEVLNILNRSENIPQKSLVQITSLDLTKESNLRKNGWSQIPSLSRELSKEKGNIFLFLQFDEITYFTNIEAISLIVGNSNKFNPSIWCKNNHDKQRKKTKKSA